MLAKELFYSFHFILSVLFIPRTHLYVKFPTPKEEKIRKNLFIHNLQAKISRLQKQNIKATEAKISRL